jgi:hypothetical protein
VKNVGTFWYLSVVENPRDAVGITVLASMAYLPISVCHATACPYPAATEWDPLHFG